MNWKLKYIKCFGQILVIIDSAAAGMDSREATRNNWMPDSGFDNDRILMLFDKRQTMYL